MLDFLQFSVSDFLEQLHEALSPEWFHSIHCGFNLEDEQIAQSVHEASEFFNMSDPAIIKEDWTTGVMTNSPTTPDDDVLVFNRAQMTSMGITDKMGFDLVMTHEAAHRALDGLDVNFNSHQEELCCDFMAGVRAGLNGLDESKMEHSLGGTQESLSHPWGVDRVIAIEKGVAYAQKFMNENDGNTPSFSNCIAEFQNSNICEHASHDLSSINDPSTLQGVRDAEQPSVNTDDVSFHGLTEADRQRDISQAKHDVAAAESRIRHNASIINSKMGTTESYSAEESNLRTAQKELAKAHEALNKAYNEHPDVKGFADVDNTHFTGHRGQYGNATGDYIDDSYPVDDRHHGTFKGFHVEDRAWNMRQAAYYDEREKHELHEAKLDSDAGRMKEAAEHARLAASYHSQMEEAKHAASICKK